MDEVTQELSFVETIQKEIELTAELAKSNPLTTGLITRKLIKQCLLEASTMPTPKQLFKSLIFEGELTILMADTNVGKSIFMVQVANEIAKQGFKVLFLDLEMSDIQFFGRYSDDNKNFHAFSDNVDRATFATDYSLPENKTYDDYFIECLISSITQKPTDVVIVDNMTALSSLDTDSAKNAKPLMDRLNKIKRQYNLTLILLEHTRKTAKGVPISLNDLQGSKMKANFADAVFSIGKSETDEKLRYVKQLKARSTEIEYGLNNVIVYELVKDVSFLHFKHLRYGSEWEHIKNPTEDEREDRILKAKDLKEQGWSNVSIAKELGVSEGAVRKWLNNART